MSISRLLAHAVLNGSRAVRLARSKATQAAFAHHGDRFRFDPGGSYTYQTLYFGNDVSIGIGAVLWAVPPAYIEIQDKVMLGPNVSIIAGDHIIDTPGQYLADQRSKRPQDDLPVIIEQDVWIGANVTVLKGVRIGRGSVIAAGTVLTKSVKPYSIMAGVPGRLVRMRFSDDQILSHEALLSSGVESTRSWRTPHRPMSGKRK